MRSLLVFVVFLVASAYCNAFAQSDSLFVTVSDDTVKVWNINVQANCVSRFAFSIVSKDSNTFTITERDTIGPYANCICTFQLYVVLSGAIRAGENHVEVYRRYLKQVGYSSDTTVFIGSAHFTIGVQAPVQNALSYQSDCHQLASIGEIITPVPSEFCLHQCYPNPSNPTTTIKFELPKTSVVRLSVYDILGREVSVLVNERMDAGVHEVKFDGTRLSSGVYFCRLQAGDFTQTKRLMILK